MFFFVKSNQKIINVFYPSLKMRVKVVNINIGMGKKNAKSKPNQSKNLMWDELNSMYTHKWVLTVFWVLSESSLKLNGYPNKSEKIKTQKNSYQT